MRNEKGGIKILVAILIILIIIAGVLFVMKFMQDKNAVAEGDEIGALQEQEKEEIPQPKTFAGDERLIAVMIDNHIDAMPQAGLEQADLVYEIIVEGGETRLMMLLQNKDLDKIGPIRSARHYFIDYALENDAIYVHFGQSPQAESDIRTLGVADINGINESATLFWRDNGKYAPHNAVTSTENLETIFEREGFRTTRNNENVLNYVAEEVELEDIKKTTKESNNTEDVEEVVTNLASSVTIPYSIYNTVEYKYNETTKTYTRYSRDNVQKDWNTGNEVEVKNIIITKCENSSIDSYGRQTIDNIGTLDGYYITNGKYIPIKCQKTSRKGQTVYKDMDGNEIKINDGKTFIQICPIDSDISFE